MVMTTAIERRERREKRRAKEERRRMVLSIIRTGFRYAAAMAGEVLAAAWLAIVMWDNPDWALTISWVVASLAIGAVLFHKTGKRRNLK